MGIKKKIVITGGPGSGKTTLIRLLESRGFTCFNEISREYIERGKSNGVDNAFEDDPVAFSQKIWTGRIQQYQMASHLTNDTDNCQWVFFDRGLPDVVAYLDSSIKEKKQWEKELKLYPYEQVFLLAPHRSIYQKDDQRFESFEQAFILHKAIKAVYESVGKVCEVPFLAPADRVNLILNHCHGLPA